MSALCKDFDAVIKTAVWTKASWLSPFSVSSLWAFAAEVRLFHQHHPLPLLHTTPPFPCCLSPPTLLPPTPVPCRLPCCSSLSGESIKALPPVEVQGNGRWSRWSYTPATRHSGGISLFMLFVLVREAGKVSSVPG